jgi:hypothetical protein
MQVSEHEAIASTFWSIVLVRQGDKPVELGTVPSEDDFDEWFSGAFSGGVLPDPPRYTDEIQCWECVGDRRTMKKVWRLSWHMFEAKMIV